MDFCSFLVTLMTSFLLGPPSPEAEWEHPTSSLQKSALLCFLDRLSQNNTHYPITIHLKPKTSKKKQRSSQNSSCAHWKTSPNRKIDENNKLGIVAVNSHSFLLPTTAVIRLHFGQLAIVVHEDVELKVKSWSLFSGPGSWLFHTFYNS